MKSILTAMLLLAATPHAAAQVVDPLATTTDPADRAMMADVASAVASRSPDIARLNALLARLPRPTPLRGLVQTVRAAVLGQASDVGPAVAAVEEALRLLPDDPRPKLVAAGIYTFSGSPQRAADLWMEASLESPDLARLTDRYVMMALTGRLTDLGDRARADRLSARLGDIGFAGGLAPERSEAALGRLRETMRAYREGDATPDITGIGDPDDLLSLYIDRRYVTLWPRIAEWAGVDLAAQSRRYLEELRGDWTAADDFVTAAPYARRLARLEAHAAVVALFLPMFDRVQPGVEQEGIEYLAPVVARSLARLGRAAEARALLAKTAATMPTADMGNALNVDGAYVTLAATDADWSQVLTRTDAFLARARDLGSMVNRSSVLSVQAWRACALWQSGRAEEARQATAEVLLAGVIAPGSAMYVHLCHGDIAAARALVIERLADDTTRGWALSFVQPHAVDTSTPLARLIEPVARAVRSAADVVAAAGRVGRILPQPVNAALPAGFDPFRARPSPRPLDASAT